MIRTYREFLNERVEYNNNLLEEEGKELSPKQRAYNDLMLFGLAKFGAESPADLSTDDKSEFFNWIKDNWDKEKGEPKEEKVKNAIEKAKEKGLIPSEPKAELSDEDKEKEEEEKAKKKRKEFDEIMNDD